MSHISIFPVSDNEHFQMVIHHVATGPKVINDCIGACLLSCGVVLVTGLHKIDYLCLDTSQIEILTDGINSLHHSWMPMLLMIPFNHSELKTR